MPTILVADAFPDKALALLRAVPGLDVRYEPAIDEEGLVTTLAKVDALLVTSRTQVTERVLAAGKKLAFVGRAGTSVENIDVPAASKRGVIVAHTPGSYAVTAAEHAIALLFSLARSIPQASATLRAGAWEGERFRGHELTGKTIGILGLGHVGQAVAIRARGLAMRVVAYDPVLGEARAAELGVDLVTLDTLLARADVISAHVPLSDTTRGLVDDAAIAKMKPGVLLVNTAAGGVFDEDALLRGLESGHLGGVALDVFAHEPPGDHPLLRRLDVIATPHLGASTAEAEERTMKDLAEQTITFFETGTVRHAVNAPSLPEEARAHLAPYLDLASRLGSFLAQIEPLAPRAIEVEIVGVPKQGEAFVASLVATAVAGVLRHHLGSEVNHVSAPFVAKERGIVIRETRLAGPYGRYASLLRVKVIGAGRVSVAAEGALGIDGSARLVGFHGFEIEAPLSGSGVVMVNDDRPGVIGAIGTIFGKHFVNVARVQLGARATDRKAVSVWNLDLAVPRACLAELEATPHVSSVKALKLPA